jgi:hypothetical protein
MEAERVAESFCRKHNRLGQKGCFEATTAREIETNENIQVALKEAIQRNQWLQHQKTRVL